MEEISHNCVICGEEFESNELQAVALSAFNTTKYKICKYCSDISDPKDDFAEVKNIIKAFVESDKLLK